MTLRLSTAQMQYDALSMMRARQTEISKYQQQIASGVKLTRGADDPTGIADVQHLDHALASLGQFDRNSTLLGDRLRQQEAALADAGDLLQRARELAVQAGNGALSDSDRHAIVVELRGLRESMLQIANRDDGRGRQLFAGTQDGVKPFTSGAGAVSYLGNDGQNLVDVAPDTALADTDAGSRVFMNIPTGDGISRARAAAGNTGSGVLDSAQVTSSTTWNGATLQLRFPSAGTYEVVDGSGNPLSPPVAGSFTPGQPIDAQGVQFVVSGNPAAGDSFTVERSPNQDIFATLQTLADALDLPGNTSADVAKRANALRAGQEDLASAQQHLLDIRAETGIRMNNLDSADAMRSASNVAMTQMLSGLRDTDLADAISKLQYNMTALDAAQRMMARLQSSSLFDKL